MEEFKEKCSKHFTFLKDYLSSHYDLILHGFTGVFRNHEGNYSPWGELFSDNDNLKKTYKDVLQEGLSYNFRFASVLFGKKNTLQIPYLFFYRKGKSPKLSGDDIVFITSEKNIDSIPQHIRYIFIEYYENRTKENDSIYSSNLSRVFTRYRANLSFSEENLDAFIILTGLMADEIDYLLYLPFQPLKNYSNGCIFLYLSQPISAWEKIPEVSWVSYGPLQEDFFQEFQIEYEKNTMKSAVAAIMGRNMSHNIGSHVLSNLKNETNKIAESISCKKSNGDNIDLLESLKINNDFFNGLSWFINYLQERQDYIATISGFENQTFIPVNFKTFILDGFLPDHHHMRHNGDTSIKNYKNLLLEHIATSENLKRENIKTYFSNNNTSNSDFTSNCFPLISQLNVSLPGGILGRQAFFSIMENFIRNAAKHSMNNSNDLNIYIDCPHIYYDSDTKTVILKRNDTSIYPNSQGKFKIEDKDYLFITKDNKSFLINETNKNDYYKLTFDENDKLFYFIDSNNCNKIYVYEYDPHEFILFTLTDNLKAYSSAKDSLDKALKDPLVDNQSGILNPKYKGIKEMRISALWMRGIMITDLEKEQFPPILQIKPSKDNSIEYSFFLLKPKELLIVLTQENLEDIIKKYGPKVNKLRNSGVEFICTEDINKGSNFRHSLFVIDSSIKKYDKSKFNQRITHLEYVSIKKAFEGINLDSEKGRRQFIAKFWRERQKELLEICIFDDAEVCNEGNKFFTKITNYNEHYNCKILFKKHNDTKSEFLKFKQNNPVFFNSLVFLEGISGGNSTHMYMRKLIKDNLLYFKLLESCLTKVLIIDERIWNNNLKYSINQIGLQVLDNERINNFMNQNYNKTQSDWINNFSDEFNVNQDNYDNLYSHRDELDKIKNSLLRTGAYLEPTMVNSPDDDYSFHFYHKKNIQLMNILYKEEGSEKSFHFYNLKKEMYYKLLQRNNNNIEFIENVNGNSFDIICIHQGIIDKIHEKFHVEFQNIFEKFSHLFPKAIKIVHSGRSKPASEIPEGYNFLPYSSLENAFNDCKFSLTEVLYNVKKDL